MSATKKPNWILLTIVFVVCGVALVVAPVVIRAVYRIVNTPAPPPAPWTGANVVASAEVGDIIVEAIEAYRKDFGAYPVNLGLLTPDYLESIPASLVGDGDWSYSFNRNMESPLETTFRLSMYDDTYLYAMVNDLPYVMLSLGFESEVGYWQISRVTRSHSSGRTIEKWRLNPSAVDPLHPPADREIYIIGGESEDDGAESEPEPASESPNAR